MAFDKREAKTWRQLQLRVTKLEKASRVREEALRQLGDKLGFEIDLTRMPSADAEYAAELTRKSSRHLLESEEVIAYLRGEEDEVPE